MKLEGSLINRLQENVEDCESIEVGMGATRYYYSDREPYEVVAVQDQKHISVRRLDAIRTDKNGMSESQTYKFIQNENNEVINLVKRQNNWYEVTKFSKADWLKRAHEKENIERYGSEEHAYNYFLFMSRISEQQYAAVAQGKEVRRYTKMNIRIGYADKYYDFSF